MKKLLLLAALPLFLIGCNSGGEGGDGGDTSGGEHLPYSEEQASNKLADLAKSSGFEIVYEAKDSEDTNVSATVGIKNGFHWYVGGDDHTMFSYLDGKLTNYDWSSENSNYVKAPGELEGELAQKMYDTYLLAFTGSFYAANAFDDGDPYFHKVKDLTFVGRSAVEYSYDVVSVGVAEAHYKAIIDKDLGITLYWKVSGSSSSGSGFASFEITSFKTGDAVSIPPIAAE